MGPEDTVVVAGETRGDIAAVNAGAEDAYVRKLAADGTPLWTRQFGTPADEYASGRSVDPNGYVLLTGGTDGTFGTSHAGGSDMFVRRLNPEGTHLWTRQFGTAAFDFAYGVATDVAEHVIVVGGTRGDFAGHAGGEDGFVRKIDAEGQEVWRLQFGRVVEEVARGVAVAGRIRSSWPAAPRAWPSRRRCASAGTSCRTSSRAEMRSRLSTAVTGCRRDATVRGVRRRSIFEIVAVERVQRPTSWCGAEAGARRRSYRTVLDEAAMQLRAPPSRVASPAPDRALARSPFRSLTVRDPVPKTWADGPPPQVHESGSAASSTRPTPLAEATFVGTAASCRA